MKLKTTALVNVDFGNVNEYDCLSTHSTSGYSAIAGTNVTLVIGHDTLVTEYRRASCVQTNELDKS